MGYSYAANKIVVTKAVRALVEQKELEEILKLHAEHENQRWSWYWTRGENPKLLIVSHNSNNSRTFVRLAKTTSKPSD